VPPHLAAMQLPPFRLRLAMLPCTRSSLCKRSVDFGLHLACHSGAEHDFCSVLEAQEHWSVKGLTVDDRKSVAK
jgi:hypothetical protein